ncbi:Uncharacterised protein [Vibrio cholerae]|nr:Uncharacterised protein [Vibrio cholerae]CSI95415.1 Uncharacterised protein [Vibrio cholerae]
MASESLRPVTAYQWSAWRYLAWLNSREIDATYQFVSYLTPH